MTTADHDHLGALRARAERGQERGAPAVLAQARTVPLAELATTERHRSHRRVLAAAAALLVVVAGGLALASRSDDRARAGVERWCEALATPGTSGLFADGDVLAYLPPAASNATLRSLAAELEADRRVEQVEVVDRAAAYARFRKLFAGSAVMLENVRPADLPTWVSVDLIDPDDAQAMAAELRRRTDLFEVREGVGDVRTLDLLVWPGTDPPWGTDADPGLTGAAYGPDWAERSSAVLRSAPEGVSDDVRVLLDAIEHRPDGEDDPKRPSRAQTSAAAAAVRAEAQRSCGLEVSPRFAGD